MFSCSPLNLGKMEPFSLTFFNWVGSTVQPPTRFVSVRDFLIDWDP